jgi:hypothetical protein
MCKVATDFLTLIFAAAPDNTFITVWTAYNRRSRFFPVQCLGEAAVYAVTHGAVTDVYTGCGLQGRDLGPHTRGGVADVAAITAAWADLDVVKPQATKPYLRSLDAALDLLEAAPIRPTLAVASGGGLHPWWVFKEPLFTATPTERAAAAHLVKGWQETLRRLAEARGATLDATHDLGRILRIPGTINHKHQKPVTLLWADGPRISPSDFETWLPELSPRAATVPTYTSTRPFVLRADAAAPAAALSALLANDSRFARTWRRERPDLRDQSASGYDLALASLAVWAGWSDQAIVDLLIAHRRMHRDRLKLRPDYFLRTLARARAHEAADAAFEAAVTRGLKLR